MMTVKEAINGRKDKQLRMGPVDFAAIRRSLKRPRENGYNGDGGGPAPVPSILVSTVLLAAIGGATYVLAPLTRRAEERAEDHDDALAKRVARLDQQVTAISQRLQQLEEYMAEVPA